MSFRYISEEDQESIDYATKMGVEIPTYTMRCIDCNGQPFERKETFTPAQLRAITAAPFPYCLTRNNCAYLIRIWNAQAAGKYTYSLI